MVFPRRTILFSGMVAGDPFQGGATWAALQYVLGFRRLGHEVLLVEPIEPAALQPAGASLAESANARYFRQVVVEFGLEDHAALLLGETQQTVGLDYAELRGFAARTDLLVNVSGMLADPALIEPIPTRAYLDLDPAFIQLWHEVAGIDMRFGAHNRFVTIGQAIGTPECAVPTGECAWIPTPQPIVLEQWPVADAIAYDAFTTVGNWRGYGSVEYQGVFYGQKAHAWRPLMQLPTLTDERFMPALAIHPDERADLEALAANRWQLLDPAEVAGTPASYQRFIQGSRAELGIAKSGYVASRAGWFSDRSLCYLASGRPVVAQETGFSRFVPTGEGLFAFETIDDALTGIEALRRDYPRHARAARALAETHFDSDHVLGRLLDRLLT
jgi:hypothetical protein